MQVAESRHAGIAARFRFVFKNGGVSGVLIKIFHKLANRVTRLLVLRTGMIAFDEINTAHLGKLAHYRHGLYPAEQLRGCTEDPDNDLAAAFIDYAAAQGDRCYAIFEGDKLVNYCWTSQAPTMIEPGLRIEFSPDYYYRYKEYTRPSHRGRRLSSFNHAESMQLLSTSGKKGFAGYVEMDNYISYRSLLKMNHTFAGFVVILGKGQHRWIWHSPKARKGGFRVFNC